MDQTQFRYATWAEAVAGHCAVATALEAAQPAPVGCRQATKSWDELPLKPGN